MSKTQSTPLSADAALKAANDHDDLDMDVTAANTCLASVLDASVDISCASRAKAVSRKHQLYQGKIEGTYKATPFPLSTSGK